MKNFLLLITGILVMNTVAFAQYTGGNGDGYSSGTSMVGWASVTTSQITASPTSITGDGSSTSTITVQLKDIDGNNLTTGGETVVLSSNHGTLLGSVTDNNDGTYTQTLQSSITPETATITGTLNGNAISDDATVFFTATAGPLDHFVFTTIGNHIKDQPFGITIAAKDASNITVTSFTGTVTISSTGTLSAGGGTSPSFVNGALSNHNVTISNTGSFTISADDGSSHTGTSNSFSVLGVSLDSSRVTVAAGSITSGDSTLVTFHSRDSNGDPIAATGLLITFSLTGGGTSSGTFGTVVDNSDGTYQAYFRGIAAGTAKSVSGAISGNPITSTLPTITVTPGAVSLSQSLVTIIPGTVVSGSTSTITLQAKDANGNNLTTGGLSVAFTLTGGGLSNGTIGSVSDNSNGTYTATFTGTTAGSAKTVSATIGGNDVTSTLPLVTVTPGAVSLSQSLITVLPDTILVGGTSTVSLQTKDANGNNLATTSGTVTFSLSGGGTSSGTFGSVVESPAGKYTTTFTGTSAGTAKAISATIAGNNVTSVSPTIAVVTNDYRSKQSGNWSSASTWEVTANGTTWVDATTYPTETASSITIQSTHTVTADIDITISGLVVSTGGTLTTGPAVTINLTGNSNAINGTLTVATGTIVDVSPGGSLTVNNGTLTLEGTGALIGHTVDALVTGGTTTLTVTPNLSPEGFSIDLKVNSGTTTITSASSTGFINDIVYVADASAAVIVIGAGKNITFHDDIFVRPLGVINGPGTMTHDRLETDLNDYGFINNGTVNADVKFIKTGSYTPKLLATSLNTPSWNNIEIDNADGLNVDWLGGTPTVTINGTLTLTSGTFNLSSFDINLGNNAKIVRSGGALSKALIFGTSIDVTYTGTSATSTSFELPTSTSVLDSLTVNNSGGVTLNANRTVNGALIISSGTLADGGFTLTAKGNIANSGTHSGSGKISLSGGASSHTLSGSGTYGNLELNDTQNASLTGSPTVNGTLTLTSGNITTVANTLSISSSGSVSRTSGHIIGNLKKHVATGTNVARTFEIGDASNYAPVNLTFADVSTLGNVTATTAGSEHSDIANSGVNSSKDVNRNWTLTNTGVVFTTYSATMNFVPSDLDGGATTGNFIVAKKDGGTWTRPTVGTKTATSTQATGMSSMSDFAVGELNTYTITSSAVNGSITPNGVTTKDYGTDQQFIFSANTGYHLDTLLVDGVLNTDSTTSYTFSNITANHTITAKYAINTYTITSSATNGTITPSGVTTKDYGTSQQFTFSPATGYHLDTLLVDGVLNTDSTTSYTFSNITANHTITAKNAINTYTLTYTAGANGSIGGTTPQTVDYNTSGTAVTALPAIGYHFVNWSDASTDNPRTDANVTADISVTANFAINTYTLTVTQTANGTITPGTTVVDYGDSQAFSIAPATGYHIDSVYVDGSKVDSTTSYTFSTVTANHSITAYYSINSYTLTVTQTSNGTITPGTTNVNYGGSQAFSIAPATGYHIDSVYVDGSKVDSTTSYTFSTVTANHSITAYYSINTYTLTYTAGANGSIGGTTPQTVNYNTSGTAVTALPATGYHFVNWSDASTDNPRTDANVTADISVTANFAINTYNLTSSAVNGSITPNGVTTKDYGTDQQFIFSANTGYHLDTLLVDGVLNTDSTTSYTFSNITANHTITAKYAINTYTITSSATNGTITPSGVTTKDYGTSQQFTFSPATGYHLDTLLVDGVLNTDSTTSYTFSNITANHTITAKNAINTYTLTYTAGANGSIGGTTPQTVDYNTSGTAVTALPAIGYHFVNWSDASTDNPRTDANVTADISVTANFAINTYTLTVTQTANGTITPGTTVVDYGDSQAFSIAPATGYHIDSVYVDGSKVDSTTSYTFSTVTANHSITAYYSINSYTLTVTQTSNGTITPGTTNVNYGGSQAFSIAPATGYHIDSVYVDGSKVDSTTSYTFSTVTANHSITAYYSINTYTLTYTAGANGSIGGTTPQTVNYNTSGTAVTALPATGYHFVNWSDASTDNPRTDANVTADISVTANFAINTYNLTSSAVNGSITPNGVTTKDYGTDQQFIFSANTGYHLDTLLVDGVLNTDSTTSYTFSNITANHTITAKYAINTYTITSSATNGTITPSGVTTKDYGTSQQFTFSPATGYHLDTLLVDGVLNTDSTTSYTFSNITANHTITAKNAINTYTLTYTAGANGSIGGTTPQTVDYNTSGTAVTALPAIGYHFVNWSDASTDNPRTDANVTADISVTANFAINTYTLTVTQTANGTITPGTTVVDYGDSQAFSIAPATGYHIDSVYVDGSKVDSTTSYTFSTVTANHSITAYYSINSYTLTVTQTSNGTITPGTTNVNYGGSQAFSIAPATGYHIDSVYVDGSKVDSTTSYTFSTVTANHSITAYYSINTYTLTYTAGANGSIGGTTPQTVNYNTSGTAVTALPATGYHFVNWSDASTDNPRTDANVTADISVTANFAINTYNLTSSAVNGSITPNGVTTKDYGTDQQFIFSANTGYHLDTLLVDGVLNTDSTTSYTFSNITANHTITAKYAINTYTITSSATNGTITPSGVTTKDYGTSQQFTFSPATGYHLDTLLVDGVLNTDSTTSYTFSNITANHTITAKNAINTYTLTYTAGANGSIGGTTPQTVDYNTSGTAVTALPAIGYHFVNWSDASTDNPRTDANVTADISVTANFAINTYTLTVTQTANGTITPGTTVVDYGDSQAFSIAPATGYHIDSVYVDGSKVDSTTSYTFSTVTANHSITAYYSINSYTLTVTQTSNGTITPGTTNVNYGGSQAFSIAPATGYHIDSVYVDGSKVDSTTSYTFSTVTANHSITAYYSINTYTLTYTAGANGSIGGTTPQTVNYNTSGTAVTALPATGYHFVNWSDASTDNPRTDANVTADISVTANFAINTYNLTSSAVNGSITPNGVTTKDYGTDQQFIFSANTGYHLDTLLVDGVLNTDSTTSYTFSNITANHTITAKYAINTYTITSSATNGTITPSGVTTKDYGTSQQFTFSPATGYHLDTLLVDGVLNTDSTTSYTFSNITANHTITAKNAINTYTLTYTAGANGSIGGTTPQTVDYNTSGTAVTALPAIGYHFVNWSDASTDNPRTDANVTADISVTANFAINTYTLTVTQTANGTITPGTTVVDYGDSQAFSIAPATGYHIDSVYVDGSKVDSTTSYTFSTVTANHSITAYYSINSYTLTVTQTSNGTITPGTTNVNYGGSQAFSIAPATGYHIDSVYVDGSKVDSTTSYTFSTVTANHSITAYYSINTYTLTYTAGANGSIGGTTPQTVNYNTSGTAVTALPATGYHFVNWSDASTDNPRTDANVTADISVTANFAIDTYTISAAASANGSISPSGNVAVNHGSAQQFTFSANSGYHLDSLLVDGARVDSSTSYTFSNVTTNHTIEAKFKVNVYTWIATGSAPWTTNTNWTPVRWSPSTSDSLVFNGGGSVTVTSVPTQTIRALAVSNSSTVNLQSGGAVTLTIGGAGTTFGVEAGSALNATVANAITITLSTGAKGSINGSMTYSTAAHRLTAADASGITFQNGSSFTSGTAFSGNAFGTTNLNSIVFASGSTYVQIGGANPFGAGAPNSVVVFQTGSLYSVQANIAPSFSGRIYSNFEVNAGAFNQSATGGNALTMDNLTMTLGTLNLNLTGNINLKGNISVASGTTLTFTPATTDTINLIGTSAQSISGTGTLTFAANSKLFVNNTNGITLNRNVTLGGGLTFTNGKITTGANTLTANGTVTRTSGHVVGNFTKSIATGATSKTFEIGDANYYTPVSVAFGSVTTAGSLNAITNPGEHANIATSGINSTKDVNRSWTLTNSGIVFNNYNATFGFDADDVDGGANTSNFAVRKYSGSWSPTTTGTLTSTSTQATGLTSFSDFAVGELNTFTLTASSTNGTITPSGVTTVNDGVSQQFTFSANTGYHLDTLLVDGVLNTDSTTSYTFSNITANHTIVAKYAINGYSLTSSAVNGSITPNGVTTKDYGTDQQFIFSANTGYHLDTLLVDGVLNTDSTTSYTFSNITANHTITAKYAINTYTITSSAVNGSITPSGVTTKDYGTSQQFTFSPATGYHLDTLLVDGVLNTDSTTSYTFSNITANHTITAKNAINTYTLTYTAGANGSIGGTTPQTVDYNTSGTAVTALPAIGYHFVNWSDASTDNPRTDANVTADISVTANFAINTYTLTVTQTANGTITPGTTVVDYGDSQAFSIAPATGYHIDSVYVNGSKVDSTTSYTFSTVTANHSITAYYSINSYTLTVTQTSNGTITPGTTNVNYGGSQAFSIAPATGYHIDSVYVDGSKVDSTTSYTFSTVTANHSITAYYSINTYTLTVTQTANGTITPGTTVVDYGDSQAFSIAPATGYHIDSVYVDGSKVDSTTSYTFSTVTANHSITAYYSINSYTLTVTQTSNGTITPGTTNVNYGGSQAFSIAPATGYHIDSVYVDGSKVDSSTSYTFSNVAANHSITAYYSINQMRLAVKVLLQGPYNTGTGLMNTSLYTGGHLASHFTGATIPYNAVDSIRIDLRDSLTSGTSTIQKSAQAWLMADGSIRSFTDTTKGYVTVDTTAGNFYVVIRHRNHLAIMSASPVAIGSDSTLYNFTTAQSQAYGTNPMKDVSGGTVFGMWAGDVNGNGTIKYNGGQNDRSAIITLLGGIDITATLSGYYNADVNLNGIVKYNGGQNDRSIIITNLGGVDITATKSTNVP